MKTMSRYVSLISITGLLTSGALIAQTSGTSGTTGTSDPTRSGMSATTPRNSASSEISGGTNPDTPTNDPSGPNRTSEAGSTSLSSRALNNGVDTPALGTSDASGGALSSTGPSMGSALSNATDPVYSILQSGDHASRAQLVNQVEQRIDSQRDSMKSLKDQAGQLQGQAKSDFKAVLDDVQKREKDLKRSLKQVRNASQQNWDSARSELASNYQAYMAASSRAHLQAGTGVSFPGSSSSTTNDPARSHGQSNRDSTSTPAHTNPSPATSP